MSYQDFEAEPILYADTYGDALEVSQHVLHGDSLAVIMHNAFTVEDCTPISTATRTKLGLTKTKPYATVRRSVELMGQGVLPAMNIAEDLEDSQHVLLPAEVGVLAASLYNAEQTAIPGTPLLFGLDEFRSMRSNGIPHTDGWTGNATLTVHATAVGSGELHIARFRNPIALPQPYILKAFEGEIEQFVEDPIHTVDINPGTLIIFSPVGNLSTGRAPVYHNITTTSDVRCSISIDQLHATSQTPDRRLLKRLQKDGVNLQDYTAILNRAA